MLDPSMFRNQPLRDVYMFWSSKVVERRLPMRADIDPLKIPRTLPYLVLIDVEGNPPRFRFRLVGTQICAWAGRDVTGMYTDDPAYSPRGPEISNRFSEVVARRLPLYREQRAMVPDRDFMFCERLVLPLANDGKTVDVLLCAVHLLETTDALRSGEYRVIWGCPVGRPDVP